MVRCLGHPAHCFVEAEAQSDDNGMLLHHTRLAIDMTWQMILCAALPTSPPWCFCLLLDPSKATRAKALEHLRQVWKFVVKLEASSTPSRRRWLHQLPVLQWAVFREPMLLLELGRWSLESEGGNMALESIMAMWDGVPNTLALKNGVQ